MADANSCNGRVVLAEISSGSFAALEATARQADVKGCYIERGAHHREREMVQWLQTQDEAQLDDGQLASAQVQVLQEWRDGEGLLVRRSGSNATLPEEICAASAELVANLPSAFRDDVRADAESLATTVLQLCPTVPWIAFQLQIVHHHACWRWHQDAHVGRGIITYVGPGTVAAEDKYVRWVEFDKEERDNDLCVIHEGVNQMSKNSVLLMKGNSWPGIQGKGLTHKAPQVEEVTGSPPKRLLLKVDADYSPPLPKEDEEEAKKSKIHQLIPDGVLNQWAQFKLAFHLK